MFPYAAVACSWLRSSAVDSSCRCISGDCPAARWVAAATDVPSRVGPHEDANFSMRPQPPAVERDAHASEFVRMGPRCVAMPSQNENGALHSRRRRARCAPMAGPGDPGDFRAGPGRRAVFEQKPLDPSRVMVKNGKTFPEHSPSDTRSLEHACQGGYR
jgi:hypothetical protein